MLVWLEFIRWLLQSFSTREHFRRFLATGLLVVCAHQLLTTGDVHDAWMALLGVIIGFYFKPPTDHQQSPTERD